jgi:shikimate dehydrogenase
MRQVPFGGWNCTVPNKVKMAELCDRAAESAVQFRAVNTVVNEQGKLVGHNTDGVGWSRALREAFGKGPEELHLLLLGAGGAGRAIATQAVLEKCPLVLIANRDGRRARDLVGQLSIQFASERRAWTSDNLRAVSWQPVDLAKALGEVDLVVNATAAGLDPHAPPILTAAMLRPDLAVMDTVYGAGCEKLHREVTAAGAQWSDGLAMLLHQGAAAFSIWTGRDAPLEVMRAALVSALPQPRDASSK